jgi:D-apionolactonase
VVGESVVQRLGLIVLHPAGVAGRPFDVGGGTDGSPTTGTFPVLVTAERFASGYRSMRWQPTEGLATSLAFEGDTWETEDQRAWTDASFKSYSPPLDRPHPVTLEAGATIDAAIRLEMTAIGGAASRRPARRSRQAEHVVVGEHAIGPVPPIGVAWSAPIDSSDADRLRRLRPAHLRIVVDRTRPDWRAELRRAAVDAGAVGCALQLELVAFADEQARNDLVEVLEALDVPISGVLVFGSSDDVGLVTSEASEVDGLRDRIRSIVPGPVGGGSRFDYGELAGSPVPIRSLDVVAFSLTPQIHATDPVTIIENLATLPILMRSAAELAAGRPLDLSCSFRPRFDAYASPPQRRLDPSRFDDRLAGDLGAVWLIGTLSGVMTARTERITIMEASGPAGVLAGTTPGALEEIFAAIRGMDAARLLPVQTSDGCTALAIASADRIRVLVANLRDRPVAVRLDVPRGWSPIGSESGRIDLATLGHIVIDAIPS